MRQPNAATETFTEDDMDRQEEPTTVASLKLLQDTPDARRLSLVLTEESPLAALAEEIKSSILWFLAREIHVCVAAGRAPPDWGSDSANGLFRVLGELPKIRTIRLVGLGCPPRQAHGPFPAHRLNQLLREPLRRKRLKHLELVRMCTEPTNAKKPYQHWLLWPEVHQSLQKNLVLLRKIRRFCWEDYIHENEGSALGQPFILGSILLLPRLEILNLRGWTDRPADCPERPLCFGTLLGNALADCCDSHRLEELTLRNFRIPQSVLEAAAKTLRYNAVLRVLDIDLSGAEAQGVSSFCSIFRTNRSITTTELWISYNDDWKQQRCLQRLAECLIGNTTLLVMVLKDPHAIPTAEPSQFSDADARAFVGMLETSCFGPITLELDGYRGCYAPLLRLHTYLNVEGRDQLVVPAPDTISQEMWMELLLVATTAEKPVSSHYRIDAIFQILQRNPALIGSVAMPCSK